MWQVLYEKKNRNVRRSECCVYEQDEKKDVMALKKGTVLYCIYTKNKLRVWKKK